ncbi:MAG TPA: histidine phosphatase family protein [Candidatus Limnocylindria bacterium]|nr:histidine phosphatase family protein [Candidatus Limnocylindria bacterium]
MTRRLLLVRHGVTDWNREGRFQGHRDPGLSGEGRREAALLAGRLAAVDRDRPARVVSSSLRRALETAAAITAGLGGPVAPEAEPRLMEIGQGDWEGRTHAELATDDAARYAAWRRAHGREQPPGGEPLAAVSARLEAALEDLLAGDAWPACLVSHGGTLRLMAEQILGLSRERAWTLDVDNASLSVLAEADGSWQIERWNDTAHLLGRVRIHVDEAEGEPLAL